jgi:signal transduction histidine kinase/ligand-binding sensor domain-containing protein
LDNDQFMRRSYRFVQLFLSVFGLLLFANLTISAQYRFDRWTTDEGLPQNSVNGVIQSREGYIWAVTRGGIVRFDGVRFKVFNRANTNGLTESRFLRIIEDEAGRLWFMSESFSFTKYENGKFTTFSDGNGFEGKFRGYLPLTDNDGNLMFSTDKGHFRFQSDHFEKFEIPGSNTESVICHRDRQGGIWLTDKTGLWRIYQGNVTTFDLPERVLKFVPLVYDDRFGNYWLSFGLSENYRIHNQNVQQFPGFNIWYFTEDFAGNLWIADSNGLYKIAANEVNTDIFEPSKISKVESNLKNEQFDTLTIDREGGIWAGTESGGLINLTSQPVRMLTKNDWKTGGDNVYPILEDSQNNIWMGTWSNALVKYDKYNNLKVYQPPSDLVSALFEDKKGRLWVSSVESIGYFENDKFTRFEQIKWDVDIGLILDITENAAGMWFASEKQGLFRYTDEKLTNYTISDGLPNNEITNLLNTNDGKLLIGTRSGLAIFIDGKITTFAEQGEIDRDHIRSLYEDAKGVIWIGTYDAGLIRYKDGKFKRILQTDGLFNGNVFCTLEDDFGWFWINSNNGIYRVRKEQLNDFADGKISRVDSIGYDKKDGLLSIEGNGGKQPAGIRRSNGEFWFPTQAGVAVINPKEIITNPNPPPVQIEEVFVDKKAIESKNESFEIKPEQNNLEINYTGLSLINSPLVKFRYRLEGLENDWNEVGTRRTAFYNNLPPGEYSFRVLAANRDGVWNEAGAAVKIIKLPFFYQTWRFQLLSILAVAVIVGFIFYLRISQLRKIAETQSEFSRRLIESQEAERKRIASELHDGLGQSLAIISNRAALGKNKLNEPELVSREFDEISNNALDALDEVQQITANLHPHYLERLGLTKALKSMILKVSDVLEIKTEIDSIDDKFPTDLEINVYRIVQESLNNIIKHSNASEAEIKIKKLQNEVIILIKDDGSGFDSHNPKSKGGGLGLVGLQERTKMLGGKILISSSVGNGTEIKVNLPTKI